MTFSYKIRTLLQIIFFIYNNLQLKNFYEVKEINYDKNTCYREYFIYFRGSVFLLHYKITLDKILTKDSHMTHIILIKDSHMTHIRLVNTHKNTPKRLTKDSQRDLQKTGKRLTNRLTKRLTKRITQDSQTSQL